MKPFNYQYSWLQVGVDTNSDNTGLIKKGLTPYGEYSLQNSVWTEHSSHLESVQIPKVTFSDYSADAGSETVNAYTFYCNSISGCKDETHQNYRDGDGTAETPWRSVNYAMKQLKNIVSCARTAQCCNQTAKYFQLKIKGTIDYDISDDTPYGGFRFEETIDGEYFPRLILTPWDLDKFTFNNGLYVYGVIVNDIEISSSGRLDTSYSLLGKLSGSDSINSIYIENSIVITANFEASVYHHHSDNRDRFSPKNTKIVNLILKNYGLECWDCTIYGGSITAVNHLYNDDGDSVVSLVEDCKRSVLINLSVDASDDSSNYRKGVYAFRGNQDCIFINCSASVDGGDLYCWGDIFGYIDAVGFYHNMRCSFYNCSSSPVQCERCPEEYHDCFTPDI